MLVGHIGQIGQKYKSAPLNRFFFTPCTREPVRIFSVSGRPLYFRVQRVQFVQLRR